MHDRYDACRCTKSKIFMRRKTGVWFPLGAEICLCTTMHSSSDAKIRICGAVSPPYIFLHSNVSELIKYLINLVFIHPFIHSIIHSLTLSLILTPFTHFLTFSAIHSLMHPLHHLFTPSCPHPLNSPTDSCNHCLAFWPIRSFACLLTNPDHDVI